MQQMVTCPNCSSQNAANQQFCVSCGGHLNSVTRQVSHVPIVTGVAAPASPATNVVTPQPAAHQQASTLSRQSVKMEVKPTWGLAWGLLWRMLFLQLFIVGIFFLVYLVVRLALGYTSVFGGF